MLVGAYEGTHFPILDPDPILAIKIRMEDRGLEHRDLLPIFGTRARVYEVLNKIRGLSVEHIRERERRLRARARGVALAARVRARIHAGRCFAGLLRRLETGGFSLF